MFYMLHCESVNGFAVQEGTGFVQGINNRLHILVVQPLLTVALTLSGEEGPGALWWALRQPHAAQPQALQQARELCLSPSNGLHWSHVQDTCRRHARGCYPSGYPSGDACVPHKFDMLQSREGWILP